MISKRDGASALNVGDGVASASPLNESALSALQLGD